MQRKDRSLEEPSPSSTFCLTPTIVNFGKMIEQHNDSHTRGMKHTTIFQHSAFVHTRIQQDILTSFKHDVRRPPARDKGVLYLSVASIARRTDKPHPRHPGQPEVLEENFLNGQIHRGTDTLRISTLSLISASTGHSILGGVYGMNKDESGLSFSISMGVSFHGFDPRM
jgi:hypothetical protein